VRIAVAAAGIAIVSVAAALASSDDGARPAGPAFAVGADCLACHNGLATPSGEDVSIGAAWQASMMAHSARDPYWQAAVRRETIDHPTRAAEIQQECAACHMPMAARLGPVDVFALLAAPASGADGRGALARDGVSCSVCHQIQPDGLGTPDTANGRFRLLGTGADRPVFGPHAVEPGLARVMHSSTRFRPLEGRHVQSSALCATCHSLTTHALGADGATIGTLPEQRPYEEWQRSAYARPAGDAGGGRSCQDCHMPEVAEPTPIASVLGQPRAALSRHTFAGGNAFMLRLLDRHRDTLGVEAPSAALEASARRSEQLLTTGTASIAIGAPRREGRTLAFDVRVANLAGHKLPTGYPSRRVWIAVTVRDGDGRTRFASGALGSDGRIAGNDADDAPGRVEPHHDAIVRADDVQIYEAAMADADGVPTTGLLAGVRYLKDNRLLPRGFRREGAPDEIAVRGDAATDATFTDGGDVVRYRVDLGGDAPSARLDVEAVLYYQPIAYRWAHNLAEYDSPETRRFVAMYVEQAGRSATVLARASATVDSR
jgi:hypothetical protein